MEPIQPEDFKTLCSDKLLLTMQGSDNPSLSPNQRLILGLITRGYQSEHNLVRSMVGTCILSAIRCLIYASLSYGVCYLLSLFSVDWLLYVVAILMLLLALFVRIGVSSPTDISLRRTNKGRLDAFELGRMSQLFDTGPSAIAVAVAGMAFGAHIGLLHFTATHMGVDHVGGFVDSLQIATNNLCHGVFFHAMELYGINVGAPTETLAFWPATVFLVFRLAYDAMLIIFVLLIWRRFRVRKLFGDLPQDATWQNMTDWMHRLSNHPARLGRILHDELIFNFLAEEYIRGNHDVVLKVSEQFANINVATEVRALFVHPATGTQLFVRALS